MANCDVAGKLIELRFVEDVGDEADSGDRLEDVVVDGNDSGAFLAAVLESVESEVAETRRFWVAVDSHNSALFARLVVVVIENQ